ELALGEAIDAIVFDDIDHVHAAAQCVRELAEPDRGRIAVARYPEIDEIAVGEVGAGEHRRHAPVHGIKAMRTAEEIGRRLRRAADAGELGHPVRLDIELETSLDDRPRDRVVAAAGAQRRYRALVVAVGVAERVLRQRGVMEFGLGDVGHGRESIHLPLEGEVEIKSAARTLFTTPPCAGGVTLSASRWSPIARAMKRAVIGVPS